MKICLAQTPVLFEEKEKNIEKAGGLIRDAAKEGDDLILFPEMSFTGFSMNTGKIGESREETVGVMKELAAGCGISIGFGWVRREGDSFFNCYTVLGKDGQKLSEYRKIHPFSFAKEDQFYQPGDSISVFWLEQMKCTAFICYDLRFPELFRAVCEEVSVIILPANWPAKRAEHWKALLRARAIENQVYILGVNCWGEINGISYSGDSCIIDPDGEVLSVLSDSEGLIRYELKDDVKRFRESFPVLHDRRPGLYPELSRDR